jgi:hypothetical protein
MCKIEKFHNIESDIEFSTCLIFLLNLYFPADDKIAYKKM